MRAPARSPRYKWEPTVRGREQALRDLSVGQARGGKWTAADRPVADTDIAAWHTIGVTHFCRPEDFPVMPCEYAGFTLKPFGFLAEDTGRAGSPACT
jgi:hypothetical protein